MIPITTDPTDLRRLELCRHIAQVFPDEYRGKAVGALLVSEQGFIVGAGHRFTLHDKVGYKDYTPHAEYMATRWLNLEPEHYRCTLYVTREPCLERTGHPEWFPFDSCVQTILIKGIKRVVVGCLENGRGGGGAEFLRNKGVEVLVAPEDIQPRFRDLMEHEIVPASYADFYSSLEAGK